MNRKSWEAAAILGLLVLPGSACRKSRQEPIDPEMQPVLSLQLAECLPPDAGSDGPIGCGPFLESPFSALWRENSRRARLELCLPKANAPAKEMTWVLHIRFSITNDGAATNVRVNELRDAGGDTPLASCIRRKVERFRFSGEAPKQDLSQVIRFKRE